MNGDALPLAFTRTSFERAIVGEALQAEAAAGESFAPLSPYSEAFQQATAVAPSPAAALPVAIVVTPTQDPVRLYGGDEGLQLFGGPAWMGDAPVMEPAVKGVFEGEPAGGPNPMLWLAFAGVVIALAALLLKD